jgi:hypothetical protein
VYEPAVKLAVATIFGVLNEGVPYAVAEYVPVQSVVFPLNAVSGVAGCVLDKNTNVPLLESAQKAARAALTPVWLAFKVDLRT